MKLSFEQAEKAMIPTANAAKDPMRLIVFLIFVSNFCCFQSDKILQYFRVCKQIVFSLTYPKSIRTHFLPHSLPRMVQRERKDYFRAVKTASSREKSKEG